MLLKYFFAMISVITRLFGSAKAVAGLPLIIGKVNTSKSEGSAKAMLFSMILNIPFLTCLVPTLFNLTVFSTYGNSDFRVRASGGIHTA